MANWQCPYCNHSIDTKKKIVKELRKNHLVDEHRESLGEKFLESNYSNRCQGLDCANSLADNPSGDPLICGECGHDHARYFAGVSGGDYWDVGEKN